MSEEVFRMVSIGLAILIQSISDIWKMYDLTYICQRASGFPI